MLYSSLAKIVEQIFGIAKIYNVKEGKSNHE